MADISDIEKAVVSKITQLLYPDGTANPSITGDNCRVRRGWPTPDALTNALRAGTVNITVYPQNNEQNVTRYQPQWIEMPDLAPSLCVTVAENVITIAGTVSTPLNVIATVNDKVYVYAVQANDTLAGIADGLGQLINPDFPATVTGNTVSIADAVSAATIPLAPVIAGLLGNRFGGALLASMAALWGPGKSVIAAYVSSKLVATVSGATITLAGSFTTPVNVAAIINEKAYVYAVQADNTLRDIATGLAQLISADVSATSSGPVITVTAPLSSSTPALAPSINGIFGARFGGVILSSLSGLWSPNPVSMIARVEGVGSVIREVKRQKRGIMICFWCPNPDVRDRVVSAVDALLGDLDYLTASDGSQARFRYERSVSSDSTEKEQLYRRDLFYSVEFGTTQTLSAPRVITQKFNLTGGLDPSNPPIKTFNI